MRDSLFQWLQRNGRTSLCVISPHLDDAVYSTFVALGSEIARREVVTVVTDAAPGRQTRWATLGGFADTRSEHLGRCREDLQVLANLGVGAVHLGARSDDSHSLRLRLGEFLQGRSAGFGNCAFLLPAGAGRQSGIAQRVWRRLRRESDALGPHPEHVQVRDIMTRALRRHSHALWGYYAEIPYILNDSVAALHRRLERLAHCSLVVSRSQPEAATKLESAAGYVSQAALALGADQASRLGFCAHPEFLFLQAGLKRARIEGEVV
jgi:hypothetical protein